MALSRVKTYALTKSFLFDVILEKYPSIKNEMIAESRRNYIKKYMNPLHKDRKEEIEKLNKKRSYGKIRIEGEKQGDVIMSGVFNKLAKKPTESLVILQL